MSPHEPFPEITFRRISVEEPGLHQAERRELSFRLGLKLGNATKSDANPVKGGKIHSGSLFPSDLLAFGRKPL
jgi:hypothetical protein